MSDSISKQALLERLRDGAEYCLKHNSPVPAFAMDTIAEEIDSGKFDSPSNQGEVKQLRAALGALLERIRRDASYVSTKEYAEAYAAYNSTSSDPAGAERVREITEREKAFLLGWYWIVKQTQPNYKTSDEEQILIDKLTGIDVPHTNGGVRSV